ncbi:MAG: histidine kinase [Methylobacterium brachiatum]|nr:histidine kinase [Methylobacterium brachiatum]
MPPKQAPERGVDLDVLAPDALDRLDKGVIGLDSDGTVVVFSEGASALSGLSREAVIGRNYFREVMPGTNVPNFRGRFLSGSRRGALDESFDYVFGRLPQPLRARVHMRHGTAAETGPVTWLTIDPIESLGAGLPREAVMAAIGRRVRAEPVDASHCEREPIHIPGSIQPNAVMLAADAETLHVLAYSANIEEIVDPQDPPLAGRPLDDVLPRAFVEAIRARLWPAARRPITPWPTPMPGG